MTVIVGIDSKLQIEAYQGQLVAIYRDAFRAPPYCKGEDEVVDLAQSLLPHVAREGFRMVVAVASETGALLGFAYGYKNGPGQLWHEEVARAVQSPIVVEWLVDSFRLVQIAVAPNDAALGPPQQTRRRELVTVDLAVSMAIIRDGQILLTRRADFGDRAAPFFVRWAKNGARDSPSAYAGRMTSAPRM